MGKKCTTLGVNSIATDICKLQCENIERYKNSGKWYKNSGKLLLVTVTIVMYAKHGSLANCIFTANLLTATTIGVTITKWLVFLTGSSCSKFYCKKTAVNFSGSGTIYYTNSRKQNRYC